MLLFRFLLFILVFVTGPALAEVQLSSAWIRALPPTQPVTAAYLKVMNHGEQAVTITGARVEGVGRVEMHTSREVEGLVRMEQLSTLMLAPGQTWSFAPGGTHLMLFDLVTMPQPGDSREVCLQLASGPEACARADVRKNAGENQHDHHQHH